MPRAKAKLKRSKRNQEAHARKKTVQHMARASIETTAPFGTAAQNVGATELESLRAMAAASLGAKTAGRRRALAQSITPTPRFDPVSRAAPEPVKAFLWKSIVPIKAPRESAAALVVRSGPRSFPPQAIKGPFLGIVGLA